MIRTPSEMMGYKSHGKVDMEPQIVISQKALLNVSKESQTLQEVSKIDKSRVSSSNQICCFQKFATKVVGFACNSW